jgi:hypothetical protein
MKTRKANRRIIGAQKPAESMDEVDRSRHMLGLPSLPGRKRRAQIASIMKPTKKASAQNLFLPVSIRTETD